MKRTIMLSLIGLLSLNAATTSLAQAATGDVESAIAGMEQHWTQLQGTNNSAAFETKYIADTAVFVGDDGKVLNKEQYVAEDKATKYTQAAISDVVVHAFGTAAVATYMFSFKGTDSDGKAFDKRERVTDTWVKMPNGTWQLVASVGSPASKS
jgi:ketosteroid isomerase-like protein